MTTSIHPTDSRPTATAAGVIADRLHVTLADGRELLVPLVWFDWLASASEADRADLELLPDAGRSPGTDGLHSPAPRTNRTRCDHPSAGVPEAMA